jgi:hypothetical protein
MTTAFAWKCLVVLACLALALGPSAALTVPLSISPTALPQSRPQPWPLRGYADAVSYGVNYTLNGALNVWVEHKPIPGAYPAASVCVSLHAHMQGTCRWQTTASNLVTCTL